MLEEFGLIKNLSKKQLEEILHRKKIKTKYKTVRDFINSSTIGPDNIIDAEIVKEPIEVKIKNQEL